MTLVETLVALTVFAVLFGATLKFLDQQSKMVSAGTIQMEAIQNQRYSLTMLERDLTTLGTNVPTQQPTMVYADTHVVVINADHSSNVPFDPWAMFVDTTMDILTANAVTFANRFQIPRTAIMYPDVTYNQSGQNSPAETIIFFFQLDASTARADDYNLFRQVNDRPPEMIARNLLRQTARPFFEYFRRRNPGGGAAAVSELVPLASLPLRHTNPLHGVPADTAASAAIDSLRAIRVNFRTTDGQPGAKEKIFIASRTVAMPNAGQVFKKTCGDAPLLGAGMAFTATRVVINGVPVARLSWNAAVDDTGGERDVIRYAIYKTVGVAGPFIEPYMSLPTGTATYVFNDANVSVGQVYYYAIAAQDCTPSLSTVQIFAVPVIP